MTFNVMSLVAAGRLEEILHHSRRTGLVVGMLQGTRLKAKDEGPIEYTKKLGYHIYSAGYVNNKHAGVQVYLDKRVFHQKHVRAVAWPQDPALAGRALAIRTVKAQSDMLWVPAYVPTAGSGGTAKSLT